MATRPKPARCTVRTCLVVAAVLASASAWRPAHARQNIREAFFETYPGAVGSVIETLPSFANHCGMCHYDFSGGGPRNPYGVLLEAELENHPNNPTGRRAAVEAIENEDPDQDGFSSLIEITDLANFSNTPTFAGLTPANVSGVQNVADDEIEAFLVPSTGGDVIGPEVEVIAPGEGEMLVANAPYLVQWTATDPSGVAAVNLYLSLDGGATFDPVAVSLTNSGEHLWHPANRPTAGAVLLVEAIDNAFNVGSETSDTFHVVSPPGGVVPTTLRDFDQPGSQPFEAGVLNAPEACVTCHGVYDEAVEPWFNWQGSMMAHASRDPLFSALMVISNQDAPDSGDMCLRCHLPRGWLQGRSVPTDGSSMLPEDHSGVACDLCHRAVDPFFNPAENPAEDEAILAGLSFPAFDFGNGMYTVDPTGARRGPFVDADTGHPILVSPFHREAAMCGTCHDVSNPAFENDGSGNYVANAFDAPAESFSAHVLAPVERTYSEWFYSEYNTPGGVYAPEFGGNLDHVATCQDCHMRDVTGQGCNFGTPPVRDDLPLHDMTGGSTWLAGLLPELYPEEVDPLAIANGIERARYMLQNAAELTAGQEEQHLMVTVVNNTGHKLPTGYPEGRRIWINVQYYDDAMQLLSESGAYDANEGILTRDPEIKVYEAKPGVDDVVAGLLGIDPGPTFHFVLNNKIYKDNRIPPRGFTNASFEQFGGTPVDYAYPDGQYWDDTLYDIPIGATYAEVRLYYQSTSKEFIEFLRDENDTDGQGQAVFDLWNDNGKCPPELMAMTTLPIVPVEPPCPADLDGNGTVDVQDLVLIITGWGACDDPPAECPDVTGDGVVDVQDLVEVITNWGDC